MTDEEMGNLEAAIVEIDKLKGFPVSLWRSEHFARYNHAFEVFWSHKPSRSVFCELMAFAPITPEIIWRMTQGDRV